MPLFSGPPVKRPHKRLIVACDGTWLNSDNGLESGKPQLPSNVTRICRSVLPESDDGIPQIVYYQAGVGSGIGFRDRVVGGSTGLGLSEHIREGYDFIANNYLIGDEIYLIGFSRGAFTARSIAALIGIIGVLTKLGQADFYAIFQDYRGSQDPDYRSAFPNVPFSRKPNIKDPAYCAELVRRGLTTPNVPIKAIGVWDTVGALGIPRIGIFDMREPNHMAKDYAFEDTIIGEHIENGFQALALDEHREPFAPSVWEKSRRSRTYLKQVWFPGVHSNIGGGYDDSEISNITLAWMMSELDPFLDFSPNYVQQQDDLNRQFYDATDQRPRPWSFGEILDSSKGIYALAGSKTRTPGDYTAINRDSGRPTGRLLRHTNEHIHASVRARWGLKGPGIEDKGVYKCEALRDWKNAVVKNDRSGERQKQVVWEYDGDLEDMQGKILYEDTLGEFERRLLGRSPFVYDKILGHPPKGQLR